MVRTAWPSTRRTRIGFTWRFGGGARPRVLLTAGSSFRAMAAPLGETCSHRIGTFTTLLLTPSIRRFSMRADLNLPRGAPPTAAKPGSASGAIISNGATGLFRTPRIPARFTLRPSAEVFGTAPLPAIHRPWKILLRRRSHTVTADCGRHQNQ